MPQITLVLHNIRSVHNVGSIFRTADAAGVTNILLSGYTPTPLDRFGRERKDLSKVALGAQKSIKWEQVKNPYAVIAKLKSEGFVIVAVEQDTNSTPLFNFKRDESQPIALLLGNEVRGLSKALLAKCDTILEIPMRGHMVRQAHHPRNLKRGKESLNVSVSAGIALFTLLRPAP